MILDIVSGHDAWHYPRTWSSNMNFKLFLDLIRKIVPGYDPLNIPFCVIFLYRLAGIIWHKKNPPHLPLNWIRTFSLFLWNFFRQSWKITFRPLFFEKKILRKTQNGYFPRNWKGVSNTYSILIYIFPRLCPCCCSPSYFAWLWSLVVVLLFYLFLILSRG
jgi:hypothetical protein